MATKLLMASRGVNPLKFSVRKYNRCRLCGRPRLYITGNLKSAVFAFALLFAGRSSRRNQGKLVNEVSCDDND